MKMKKIIAGVSALTLAAVMSMNAFAQAEEQYGATVVPVDGQPTPNEANTRVLFSTDPDYTVTIPATVQLAKGTGTAYTGTGDITAANVFLKEDQTINVTINSASGFKLSAGGTYALGYTVSVGGQNVANGGQVAAFANDKQNPTQTVTLSFETAGAPDYAGDYSDTVVFGISVS